LKRAESRPARMRCETDAVEWLEPCPLKTGRLTESAALIRLLPNEERFVSCVKWIDLKFIISISASDEDLHVVVVVDRRIVGREFGADEWLLDANSDIKILLVPENRGPSVMDGGLAGNEVDIARRARR